MERVSNMTSGNPTRLIFSFSLPLMFGGMFQQIYMIVDSIIVSRGVGLDALAALGAADWVNWMVLWSIMGFTHGLSVLIAQEFGAGRMDALRKGFAMILKACAVFGVLLTAGSLLMAQPLLRFLRTDPAIIDGSRLYLHVLFAGSGVMIAYNMAAAILRCLGNSCTPLIAVVAGSIGNIALDLLFVLGFNWGIFGAAIATVLAQFLSFLICARAIVGLEILRLRPEDWKNDRRVLLRLCRLGIPTALQNGIIAVGGFAVQYVLNGFGISFVAGFTATNKLYGILESAAIAFGYAMTAYMGQNLGARLTARLDQGMRSVLLLSAGFSLGISAAVILFGRKILRLFISASEANAEEVMEIAYRYLFVMSVFLLFLFLVHAYRSSLQGLGNTTVPMISGVVELFARIATALLLPRFAGPSGIYFAECFAWAGAAVLMMLYYHATIGRTKRAVLEEMKPFGAQKTNPA